MATARFETLVDIFEHSTKTYESRPLFGTKRGGGWEWTSYSEFAREVDRVRTGLKALGVKRGDRVAIIADNRVEWAVLSYATSGLGAALVPMYEAQHEKEWEFIARDCSAKILVVAKPAILEKTKKLLGAIDSLTHIVLLDAGTKEGDVATDGNEKVVAYATLKKAEPEPALEKPAPTDVACIIYTSGTTGNPKGVILTHANLTSNVNAVHDIFPIGGDDRSLSFLPWAHSFGQTCELHCLYSSGASMGLCESVNKIIDNLAEVQPTLLFSVPRIFNRIYTGVQKQISEKPGVVQALVRAGLAATKKVNAGEKLSFGESLALRLADTLVFSKVRKRFGGRLKYAFSGGAAISRDVAEFIDGLGIMVYEGYGLTETSPITTANYPNNRKIGSVGKPIPGVKVVIDTNENGGKKSESGREEGEILVYGPNVMSGYYNRPEENAAALRPDGGFRTGDMGYLDKDGFLFITGRIKEQYKLENGKYVVPTPLEEALKLSPYVANVMVYGDNRPHNIALIVANVDALKGWAKGQGKESLSGEALLKDAAVKSLFLSEIKSTSKEFKGFESVADFALIDEDFTTDNGMLTPSLKLKRRAVVEKWGALIDGLYKAKAAKPEARAAT